MIYLLHDENIRSEVDVLPILDNSQILSLHGHIREDCHSITPQKRTSGLTCRDSTFSSGLTPCRSAESSCYHRAKLGSSRPVKARIVKGAKTSKTLGRVACKLRPEAAERPEKKRYEGASASPHSATTANSLKTVTATAKGCFGVNRYSYSMGVFCPAQAQGVRAQDKQEQNQ